MLFISTSLASTASAKVRESFGNQSSEVRKQIAAIEDQIDSLIIEALGLNAEEGAYIRRRVLSLRGAKEDKNGDLF